VYDYSSEALPPLRRLRWALEDSWPPLGVRLAESALAAVRPRYRREVRETRRIAAAISPDGTVAGGPFAGMRYPTRPLVTALLPKLAGTYELELQPAIEEMLARVPDRLIDVGSADGYYAVGTARRGVPVVAFESRRSGRYLCSRLAGCNGVRVEQRRRASAAALEHALAVDHPALICDIDGGERSLLDPAAVPALRRTHAIVETHDEWDAGVTDELTRRFEPTHVVERIDWSGARPRALAGLTLDDAQLAVREPRRAQSWLVLTPR
jgi:hypothetical protein